MIVRPVLILLALTVAGCARDGGGARSYGDDALPSPQVIAFQKMDTTLGYRGAHIEYDAALCAVYRGFAPDGTERQEPLLDEGGKPICASRR